MFQSPHLEAWHELQRHDRERALHFYFENILPGLVQYLLAHRRPELNDFSCDTLVSLMGFSPETTVLATALLRPKRVLAIRSAGVDSSYDLAAQFLISGHFIKFSGLRDAEVNPADPADIYHTIRRHVTGKDERAIVDVTGGKKVMSASAALAASELRIPMCYIDGDYDPQMRRPIPGSERLVLLPNPSEMAADTARSEALTTYRNADYASAREALGRSRDLQPRSPHFEQFGIDLCDVYVAWAALDLAGLDERLTQLEEQLKRPNVVALLESKLVIAPHVSALRRVASGDRLAILATFLELGTHYRGRGRHDFACLLAYRCLEGIVQFGLNQLAPGFDPAAPDYSKLREVGALQSEFVTLAQEVGFKGIDGLPHRLGFINGFMLLCILGAVREPLIPKMSPPKAVKALQTAAEKRNRSVLAHGERNLTEHDSNHLFREAEQLGRAILAERHAELTLLRSQLQPIALAALCPAK